MTTAHCELCNEDGGEILFRNEQLRIVLIDDANLSRFLSRDLECACQ
jgi:hypothetical protein